MVGPSPLVKLRTAVPLISDGKPSQADYHSTTAQQRNIDHREACKHVATGFRALCALATPTKTCPKTEQCLPRTTPAEVLDQFASGPPGRHGDNITSNLSRHITLYHRSSVGEANPTPQLTPEARQTVTNTTQRTSSEKTPRRSKRRKVKSFFRRWKSLSLRHTWLNPLLICLLVGGLYLVNPSPSNPVSAALFLSYPLPRAPDADPSAPTMYGKGRRDFAFVAFYTVLLSFTREFLMQRLLRPLAIRFRIPSRAKQSRFMEQLYTAIYFAVFGPLGLYVMSLTPVWYFNTRAFYEGFPHRTLLGIFKAYYLLQAAYWSQQMIVLLLMLEKPRKDFKELVGHHVITLALIYLSYRFHFTYMGLAVYITHDISDFFLAVSSSAPSSFISVGLPLSPVRLCVRQPLQQKNKDTTRSKR